MFTGGTVSPTGEIQVKKLYFKAICHIWLLLHGYKIMLQNVLKTSIHSGMEYARFQKLYMSLGNNHMCMKAYYYVGC